MGERASIDASSWLISRRARVAAPLGGSGDSGGRALITAAATTAATVAAIGASAGAGGLAASGSTGATSQLASFVAGGGSPDSGSPGLGGDGSGNGAGSSMHGIAAQAQAPDQPGASANQLSFGSDPAASGPPTSRASGGVAAASVAERVSEMLAAEEP